MSPDPGDFGLARGGGTAGYLVRLGTFSRYGHAVICVGQNHDGSVQIIEAAGRGARLRRVQPRDLVWSAFVMTSVQRQTIVKSAQQCIGIPYDYGDIAMFVTRSLGVKVQRLGRALRLNQDVSTKDHPDDKLICSELVVWCYRQAGIDLALGIAAGDVSPGDLADFIVRHPA